MVNRAELARIRGFDENGKINEAHVERQAANVPWGTLLRSPNMWAIMCAYFTYVYCLYIFLTWLPSYLVDARHFTLLKVGIFASLPLFAGVIGDTVGGLATDWLLKKTGNTKLARRVVAIVGLLGCAVFIVPAALTENAYTAVYCLTGARHGVGHDEHGRQFRRGHVAAGVRNPGAVRQLAGAVRGCSGPPGHW